MPKGDTLSDKAERFCQEYLIDMNATKAGIRAGYSEKSAHVTAHNMLKTLKFRSEWQS